MWNEENRGMKCDIKSQHEYEYVTNQAQVKCAGDCGKKEKSRKCSCQSDSQRYCTECYTKHCIAQVRATITNAVIANDDGESSEPEQEKQGKLKDPNNY